jgi:hypothetical protein
VSRLAIRQAREASSLSLMTAAAVLVLGTVAMVGLIFGMGTLG